MNTSDARVALLLHMHQPDYRDPETGRPGMPWVRLHASRGYTDVAAMALQTGARLTVNVVPSLLDQLQHYAEGGTDRWEELSRVPAEDLRPSEVAFLRARFVHGNPTMRGASRRYRELEANIQHLRSPQDLRDLQVWSNLCWLGFTARQDPLAIHLLEQERGYDHDQLLALMDLQRRVVVGVLPLWRQLSGLSTSALCHPILPLLIDLEHARRCLPGLPRDLGARFAWPDDARRQLAEGRARTEAVLGTRARGLWPSEGSVSPEVLAMAGELGFSWVAADEGVLHRSERDRGATVTRPWRVQNGNAVILFRDRDLSDRIGFHYQRWPGARAAQDLLEGAAHVLARAGDPGGVVPVVLDGENPWEAYPDAGEAFLRTLFQSGRTCSLDEAATVEPAGTIYRLHTGSWINADFNIWAGDVEDRLAWSHLERLRLAWEEAGRPDAAWPFLAAAEGSDWFWWYGPDFHTPFADFFDALFRAHLRAGWRALGQSPPEALSEPIEARTNGQARIGLPGSGSMAQGGAPVRGGLVFRGPDGELRVRLNLPSPRAAHGVTELARAELTLEVDGVAAIRWPYALEDGERWAEPLAGSPGLEEGWISAGSAHVEVALAGAAGLERVRLRLGLREGEAVRWSFPGDGWYEAGPLRHG